MTASPGQRAAAWKHLLSLLLLVSPIAAAEAAAEAVGPSGGDANRWIEIPAEAAWTLIGEWTRSPRARDETLGVLSVHYTLGIIALDGQHYRVSSGTLIGGCCWWPTVYRLDTLPDRQFFDPWYDARYRIQGDGTLSIERTGEPMDILSPTPPEHRFSDTWRARSGVNINASAPTPHGTATASLSSHTLQIVFRDLPADRRCHAMSLLAIVSEPGGPKQPIQFEPMTPRDEDILLFVAPTRLSGDDFTVHLTVAAPGCPSTQPVPALQLRRRSP